MNCYSQDPVINTLMNQYRNGYMKFLFLLALSSIFFGCKWDSKRSKPEASVSPTPSEASKPTVIRSKFGLSSETISKINQEMGLGTLLQWKNDAGPGEEPFWFTTLEYEVVDPNLSLENQNNVIELSLGSKGTTGSYVEYLSIGIGFMNPKDKARAKKLFLEKVSLMSDLLEIPVPQEIMTALKNETNLKQKIGDFEYEIEEYGAARRALSLTIR